MCIYTQRFIFPDNDSFHACIFLPPFILDKSLQKFKESYRLDDSSLLECLISTCFIDQCLRARNFWGVWYVDFFELAGFRRRC